MELSVSLRHLDAKVDANLDYTKMIILHQISRIETSFRFFQAVQDAHMSPLFQHILRPKSKIFYLGADTDVLPVIKQAVPNLSQLNNEQKRAVAAGARVSTNLVSKSGRICWAVVEKYIWYFANLVFQMN